MFFLGIVEQGGLYSKNQVKVKINDDLFKKIAENDMAAFEEFFYMTERSIYVFVLSILRNHEDALDVVQDTYLKILAAAHLYRAMGKPMAWVFTIARNLSVSKLRSKKQITDTQIEEIEGSPSFFYITKSEDKFVLQAAFKILNEQEREIILLHAISGLPHREIAKNLEMPLSTALSKYHRGLKKLRKYLIEQEVL